MQIAAAASYMRFAAIAFAPVAGWTADTPANHAAAEADFQRHLLADQRDAATRRLTAARSAH